MNKEVMVYKGFRYRVVTEFRPVNSEWFAIEFRRWFLFIPYWQRWNLWHGDLFYGSTEKKLFETPEAAEKAFRQKVDEATYKPRVVRLKASKCTKEDLLGFPKIKEE